jgi:hypothetical protein
LSAAAAAAAAAVVAAAAAAAADIVQGNALSAAADMVQSIRTVSSNRCQPGQRPVAAAVPDVAEMV